MKIAVIPARGGSKRIPRKNIRSFNGKPIIAYSIEAALASGCFDKVIVSTDDREISQIAQQYGAEVPSLRSAQNSDDYAPIISVMTEVVNSLTQTGAKIDYLCCIFATAPFVSSERLQTSFNSMTEKNKSAIFPVVEFSYPIQRSLEVKGDGTVGMVWEEHLLSRSQDLPKRYHDAGQYYWVNVNTMLEENTLFVKNSMAELISTKEAQDIDTIDDWMIAELKYKAMLC